MSLSPPYLIFLGDGSQEDIKTAQGVVEWARSKCLGQLTLPRGTATVHLPELTIEEAKKRGVQSLIIGLVNRGGKISESWIPTLLEAVKSGLHIVNGLHDQLARHPTLAAAAHEHQVNLHDVRNYKGPLTTAVGIPRCGLRLLTVGTDCCVGKMFSSLALVDQLTQSGLNCDFRATGQTGIMIHGEGIPIDAVPADFISGCVERLSPEAASDYHLDVIEGQGSLFNPAFSGVSLGILHGAQPDFLVVCHRPRPHIRGFPTFSVPTLMETLSLNLFHAQLTNPAVEVVGIALNTSALDSDAAEAYIHQVQSELEREIDMSDIPVVDPMRFEGIEAIANVILHKIQRLRETKENHHPPQKKL